MVCAAERASLSSAVGSIGDERDVEPERRRATAGYVDAISGAEADDDHLLDTARFQFALQPRLAERTRSAFAHNQVHGNRAVAFSDGKKM